MTMMGCVYGLERCELLFGVACLPARGEDGEILFLVQGETTIMRMKTVGKGKHKSQPALGNELM